MPRAVLFDYGLTLVGFTYPREELLRVLGEVRLWLGPRPPEPAWLMREVLEPLEAGLDSFGEEEVDYMEYYETAWRRAGLDVPRETLWRILDLEQRCWDRSVPNATCRRFSASRSSWPRSTDSWRPGATATSPAPTRPPSSSCCRVRPSST